MYAHIPFSIVPVISEPNPDKPFFENILLSIGDFTDDKKLEFRCEILKLIKRMRMPSRPQNYGYLPHIRYQNNVHESCPTYPTSHFSNYMTQAQSNQSS